MGERVWRVPQDQFVTAWNQSASLDEAAAKLKQLAGGNVPRWAAMARASSLRKDGVALKPLPSRSGVGVPGENTSRADAAP